MFALTLTPTFLCWQNGKIVISSVPSEIKRNKNWVGEKMDKVEAETKTSR